MKKIIILFIVTVTILLGCSSYDKKLKVYHSVRELIVKQRYEEAIEIISEEEKEVLYDKKSQLLFLLDMGILHHYAGNFEESNQYLTDAEYLIEELYTKSISDIAESFIVNDNALRYSGEDYENLYTNILKAINYIKLGSFDDAFVEIRRLNNKLNVLEDKYARLAEKYNKTGKMVKEADTQEIDFHNSALGRYLSHLVYYTEGKYDDAELDLAKLDEAFTNQPGIYNFDKPELRSGDDSENAKVSILCYGGPSPIKEYNTFRIKAMGDFIVILQTRTTATGERTTERVGAIPIRNIGHNFYAKIEVPYIERRPSAIDSIRVYVDGRPSGKAELIESVNNIAVHTFEAKRTLIYLKTISRAVLKSVGSTATAAAIERASGSGLLGFVSSLIFGAATEATEKADLRISRFLPGRFYVKEVFLPRGVHDVTVEYIGKGGNVLYRHRIENFNVTDSKVNLIRSHYLN